MSHRGSGSPTTPWTGRWARVEVGGLALLLVAACAAGPDWVRATPSAWGGEPALGAVGDAAGINSPALRRSTAENKARAALRPEIERWADAVADGEPPHGSWLIANATHVVEVVEVFDEPEERRARALAVLTATQLAGVIDRFEPAPLRVHFHARSKAWLAARPR